MDKTELATIVTEFCHIHAQQFNAIQGLTLGLAAIHEVMKDRGDKEFQRDCQRKIQDLQRGELGKQCAQDKAAFESALRRVQQDLMR
jgi:hypothetical protein